jgi:diguanylate cyclase (GGDEF)-like protein
VANFFAFNSLNFFSLIILSLLFVHASYYLKSAEEIIWKKVLLFAILSQALDIICWYMTNLTGDVAIAFSYIFNVMLFISSSVLAVYIALFFIIIIDFNPKTIGLYKKTFSFIVLLNSIVLLLSIPFGFIFNIDASNDYVRGNFYFITTLLIMLPPVFVFFKIVLKNIANFNKLVKSNKLIALLITINILAIVALIFLQGQIIVEVTAIFPVITISILLLHILLISKAITSDHLTSLQNKLSLDLYFSRIPNILQQYLVVIFFDLDKLKETNDNYGHNKGDAMLMAFAQILKRNTKNKDLVARVGGDEFLIILITNDLKEIDIIISSIIREVDEYNKENSKIKIDFSYGISINEPNEPYIVEELIEKADKQMYINKNQKK